MTKLIHDHIRELEILNHIRRFGRGRDRSISARALAEQFNQTENYSRNTIIHLITEHKHCICGVMDGLFFWPTSREEIEESYQEIKECLLAFNEAIIKEFGAPQLFDQKES